MRLWPSAIASRRLSSITLRAARSNGPPTRPRRRGRTAGGASKASGPNACSMRRKTSSASMPTVRNAAISSSVNPARLLDRWTAVRSPLALTPYALSTEAPTPSPTVANRSSRSAGVTLGSPASAAALGAVAMTLRAPLVKRSNMVAFLASKTVGVFLVDRLAGHPERVGDRLPGPAVRPGVAHLKRLKLLDELAQGGDRAQPGARVGGAGGGCQPFGVGHACQVTLTPITVSRHLDTPGRRPPRTVRRLPRMPQAAAPAGKIDTVRSSPGMGAAGNTAHGR